MGESGVMLTYRQRYRDGECEQVWAELFALGGKVRDKRFYAEATAVATETMTRARANIQLLVPRLTSLGYQFASPDRVFVPADGESQRLAAEIDQRSGPLPLSLRVWCEVVGEVNFMGSHPKLSTYVQSPDPREAAQGFLSLFAKHGGAATAATGDPLRQGADLVRRLLDHMTEGRKTGQPRSPDVAAGVLASQEFLAAMQRPGLAPPGPDVDSDPLVVEPYFADDEDEMDDSDDDEPGGEVGTDGPARHEALIAPDPIHKTGHSGGGPYTIRFPDASVDALLRGDEAYGTFVEYLRICFRWGGFPGLRAAAKPPREELAYLTEGLSPL
jgi:hypothetical protein